MPAAKAHDDHDGRHGHAANAGRRPDRNNRRRGPRPTLETSDKRTGQPPNPVTKSRT